MATIIFFLGRLNTFEDVISSDSTLHKKQEAIENKTFDKLSDLNISKSSPTEDLIDKEKDSFKKGDKISKKIVISKDQRDSMTAMKHISGSDEENGKLLASEDSKRDEKIATKKALLDDRELKALSSRQSEDVQVTEEEDKTSIKQMKVVTKKSSAEDIESKEDKNLNKHDDIKSSPRMQANEKQKTEVLTFTERSTDDDKYLDDSARGKSADLSSTDSRVSTLNVEENLSPERTSSPRDKKSERIKRDDRERLETETGKLKYIRALNVQKNHKNIFAFFL